MVISHLRLLISFKCLFWLVVTELLMPLVGILCFPCLAGSIFLILSRKSNSFNKFREIAKELLKNYQENFLEVYQSQKPLGEIVPKLDKKLISYLKSRDKRNKQLKKHSVILPSGNQVILGKFFKEGEAGRPSSISYSQKKQMKSFKKSHSELSYWHLAKKFLEEEKLVRKPLDKELRKYWREFKKLNRELL